jgi:hypothetical protein
MEVGEISNESDTRSVCKFQKKRIGSKTNEQYPQDILIEFAQDKCDLINGFK